MDEGQAAGPKAKWWSRPRRGPGGRPGVDAEAAAAGPVEPTAPDVPTADAAPAAGDPLSEPPLSTGLTPEEHGPLAPQPGSAPHAEAEPTALPSEPSPGRAVAGGPAEQSEAWPTPETGDPSVPRQARPAHSTATGPSQSTTAGPSQSTSTGPSQSTANSTAAGPEPAGPRHAPDPYGTPPYGEPGPWAPAPPVQRPGTTPAHGTQIPAARAGGGQPPLQPGAGTGTGSGAAAHSAQGPMQTPAHGTHLPPPAPNAGASVPGPPARARHPHETPPAGTYTGTYAGTGTETGSGTAFPGPGAADSVPQTAGLWQQYDPWGAPRPETGAHSAYVPDGAPRTRTRRGSLLMGALVLALVSGGVGGGIGAYVERNGGLTEVELPQASPEAGDRDPESVAGIAAAALPGVVTFHVKGGSRQGTGTGFVLDKQGHILTNNHVVEPAGADGEISVTFSGGEVAGAEVVGRDSGYDLAVVKVSRVSGLKPLALGNSDSVRVGDPVVAIGAPYDLAGTVTSGIISAKERPITAGGEEGDGSDISYVDALQTDAPINPGNSGGPLVDSRARVIGINSAIRAAGEGGGLDSTQGGSIGLGFAIPVNQGKRVAEELINTGRATHPVIGVTLDLEYTGDGARVATRAQGKGKGGGGSPVKLGGPGAKAGIEPGDVLTEVDGARVHSGEELIVKIRSHRPGDRLELTLERDGKERTIQLTLGTASGR
ncbi:trypsin-like peptidase domain-containing protein [Streptomyces sp. NPDC004647]|uniref:S1C family serine protease n=1 Tax=Streptomyces sp. NPDC004647 TaxID=3154671 RepID=UPI0033B186A1